MLFPGLAMRCDSLFPKFFLEISFDLPKFRRRMGFAKTGIGFEDFPHLDVVRGMIRAQVYLPLGEQNSPGEFRKTFVDKAVLGLPALGPGVRKINV